MRLTTLFLTWSLRTIVTGVNLGSLRKCTRMLRMRSDMLVEIVARSGCTFGMGNNGTFIRHPSGFIDHPEYSEIILLCFPMIEYFLNF